ncbi:UDP-N-acetylmuramate dehydrogenase [Luedemannella flava]|uniref:UDP-N-acetylenolpyruvoylglucosamine reductase n=1 Tax=Luedemannella flava TaxID=349316 RepID=A0ABN2M6I6_9ACTN
MHEITHAALQQFTTLRLGGVAHRVIPAASADEIVEAVKQVDRRGESMLLLGGGSNVVVSDDGFDGTVVLLRSAGITADGDSITVEAGHTWDDVVAYAVANGLAGIECLAGIPGAAGATPVQNVGAYGQEVAETITSVRVYDRAHDKIAELKPLACGFGYRTSRFKHNERYVVLAVTFRLTRSDESTPVRYAELARALDVPVGGRAPLAKVRETVLGLRARKGMVLDPADPDTYSVGSFFTNPVLEGAAYAELQRRADQAGGAAPPAWPGQAGEVKVSAAWLIEHAGFHKGYAGDHKGVALSGKHTLALTNRGDGSTAALLGLAREIRDGVRARFGVRLEPEPVLVNCRL